MELKRTANAGILLELDGVRLLLDGVCLEVSPYLATPEAVKSQLLANPPELVAFTHTHPDHYDPSFVSEYSKLSAGPLLGPAEIPGATNFAVRLGNVTVTPVKSHHLGKIEPVEHYSYVIEGSRCVWFMGDASCDGWIDRKDLPCPDMLIAPYSFAMGRGWEQTKKLSPKVLVLLHLPSQEEDPYQLWQTVAQTVDPKCGINVLTPGLCQTVKLRSGDIL